MYVRLLALVLMIASTACATSVRPSDAADAGIVTVEQPSIELRVVLVDGPAATFSRWMDPRGGQARIVSADAADALLDAVKDGGHVISRPRIVVRPGARAAIVKSTKIPYVKDFDTRGRPLQGTAEEGTWIDLTPRPRAGGHVAVDYALKSARLHQPIREAQLVLPGSARAVTVQLPEIETLRAACTFDVAGEDVAILPMDAFQPESDGSVHVVVVRVRAVP